MPFSSVGASHAIPPTARGRVMSRRRRAPKLAPAVADDIANYRPRDLREDQEVVDEAMPRVRALVTAAVPTSYRVARLLMWAAIRFALWGREWGIADDETLYQHHNIEAFLVSERKRQTTGWRYEMRSALRRLGTVVNPAGFPPPPPRIGRSGPPRPYESYQENGYIANAFLGGYPQRAARLFVLGASAGAGWSGPKIREARVEDLVDLRGGRIGIRTNHYAEVVPFRDAYTEVVREAAREARTGKFILTDGTHTVYNIAAGLTDKGLSLPRARATWLVAHLVAGTRLPALEAVTGRKSLNRLEALLPPASRVLTPEQAVEEAMRA